MRIVGIIDVGTVGVLSLAETSSWPAYMLVARKLPDSESSYLGFLSDGDEEGGVLYQREHAQREEQLIERYIDYLPVVKKLLFHDLIHTELLKPYLLLASLLVPLKGVLSVPTAEGVPNLLARAYTGYTGCHTEQKNRINRAFQDAAVMVRQHKQKRGSQTYLSSPAFTHYFRNGDSAVEKMLDAIGEQWQPPRPGSGQPGAGAQIKLNQFNVHITCEESPDCSSPKTKTLVITDIAAAGNGFVPQMRFCPQFFNPKEPHTKNDLDSFPYIKNPKRRQASWCKPGAKFADFEVAGTTIIHELTHLNEAGQRAGLASHEDGIGGMTRGTEDIYSTSGYSEDPSTAARQLHDRWLSVIKDKKPKNQWPPFAENLNADSYAASVTEWWFMTMCNFDSIMGN
ncbi:hypothetical protein M434DRAFT_29908 [Hypoxylon sp. CO27-5]|nr:hypothetical protein M434DRAFT_29908 [Hypoxylon sp. CO27-5]